MGESRSLVEAFYEAFNRGDLDGTRQYFSDDMENTDPSGTLHGWDAFRGFMEGFKTASPDARLIATNWIEDGNVVAVEGSFAGTFTGPMRSPSGEVPPTGRSFELPFVEVNETEGGRIKGHRVYYDQMGFLSALGLMPPGDAH